MGQPILEVEHLKKSYVNNVPILDDVSFSLQKGEVVVIVGPSGCGKSTFLRCVNRLEEIDSGVLKLNGVSYEKEKKNISKVREKIGMVFQSYDLFPNMTILNNLLLAPMKVQKRNKEEVKKEAEQLLDRVGLLDKKDNYPRQLSGGQKQRVAIVRAMLMHPEIMLLDEITAALDPEMVREVLQVVLELAKTGMTMLIVTHEMEFARSVAEQADSCGYEEERFDESVLAEKTAQLLGRKFSRSIITPEQFFDDPKTDRAKQFLNSFHYETVKK